jgi:hypothetical protein
MQTTGNTSAFIEGQQYGKKKSKKKQTHKMPDGTVMAGKTHKTAKKAVKMAVVKKKGR